MLRPTAPASVLALSVVACGGGETTIETTFDVCTAVVVDAPDATAAQLESLDDAVAMWRAKGAAGLARAPSPASVGAPRIVVRFEPAAPSFHGLYDDGPGVIYVNAVLADRRERAITIAHELGHAFGLLHIDRSDRTSVMNRANLTHPPDDGDAAALVSLWGACD